MAPNLKRQPIEKWFDHYLVSVGLVDAPPDQRREMKRAFFAGAWSVLTAVQKIGQPDISEEVGHELLDLMFRESEAFRDAVIAGRE